TLLQRCLEKDRGRRLRDMSTALYVLDEPSRLATGVPVHQDIVAVRRPLWRRAVPAGVWLVSVAMAGVGVWFATRPEAPRVTRLAMPAVGTAALSVFDSDLTFTPDGSRVIYVGNNSTQLLVRQLDRLEPTVVATGFALTDPFVSPDGQWIGFAEGTTLKKV